MEAVSNLCLVTLSLTSMSLYLYQKQPAPHKDKENTRNRKGWGLRAVYLPAHLLALFSDWLQGPYVFQLYKHYGHGDREIAVLFLAGYVSSCVFGSFTGPLADRYGRKLMGQVFCIVCGLSCLTKVSPDFSILLAGRFLSGVSTSCLYSVFESWYVTEHKSADLSPTYMTSTLALVTTANSLLAITAGLVSDLLVRGLSLGPLAPFLLSLPCLALCWMVITCCWQENRGSRAQGVLDTYREGVNIVWCSIDICRLGLVQAMVESSMFIFVYLWTPTLAQGPDQVPLGKIFSCFMISIMIGSFIFRYLISKSVPPSSILLLSTLLLLISNLVAASTASYASSPLPRYTCLLSFLLLETSLGLYFPSIATLRSQLVPGSHRSTIINLFRVPLNLLTAGTLLAVKQGLLEDRGMVFLVTSFFLLLAVGTARRIVGFGTKD